MWTKKIFLGPLGSCCWVRELSNGLVELNFLNGSSHPPYFVILTKYVTKSIYLCKPCFREIFFSFCKSRMRWLIFANYFHRCFLSVTLSLCYTLSNWFVDLAFQFGQDIFVFQFHRPDRKIYGTIHKNKESLCTSSTPNLI